MENEGEILVKKYRIYYDDILSREIVYLQQKYDRKNLLFKS